jgi:cytochrome c oxidase assembly factor CtaG
VTAYPILIAVLLALGAPAVVACPPLPVETTEHAVCLARQFAEQRKLPWTLAYQAKEEPTSWLVTYVPEGSVRGGSGEVRVNKVNGEVSVVQLYR